MLLRSSHSVRVDSPTSASAEVRRTSSRSVVVGVRGEGQEFGEVPERDTARSSNSFSVFCREDWSRGGSGRSDRVERVRRVRGSRGSAVCRRGIRDRGVERVRRSGGSIRIRVGVVRSVRIPRYRGVTSTRIRVCRRRVVRRRVSVRCSTDIVRVVVVAMVRKVGRGEIWTRRGRERDGRSRMWRRHRRSSSVAHRGRRGVLEEPM